MQCLNAQVKANGPLTLLPPLELENTLNGVFVLASPVDHCPVTEGRRLLDHGLDGRSQLWLTFCLALVAL